MPSSVTEPWMRPPSGHRWLDLDAEKWHDLSADVSAEQAGRPWLLGSRQQRTALRPSANVPRFFAFDRDDLFVPERP